MKILFYNWVDYLDDERRGGGVGVYQKNLIEALDAREDVECSFISSGISYDLTDVPPRWERVRHGGPENRERRYEIVNSGVLSPAHHSFGDERQVDDPATTRTFFDFIRETGPYDVVHFNNLEGIPAEVLTLKQHWPDTRVIFSLHNYYPVCPQVNLWHQERENCVDYDGGRKCLHCLPQRHDTRIVKLANGVAFNLKKAGIRPGTRMFDRGFGPAMRVARRGVRLWNRTRLAKRRADRPAAPEVTTHSGLLKRVEAPHLRFARRRRRMVELINSHCDRVLCVSDRVGEVAARYGIAPALLTTSYIGTRHAEKFDETAPRETITQPDGTLTMAYLGYMRRDKGFFFLLDALEALPAEMAARINLMICSRLIDQPTMDRITALSERFASLLFADGYAHDQLDELLAEVDLGVVPVLWEDNLPQVAIEMHARHIPLLTSDLGGAQELGACPEMVFKAGDAKDFAARMRAILNEKIDLEAYWKGAMAPYSMADHLGELMAVYQTPARPIRALPSAPAPEPAPLPKAAEKPTATAKSTGKASSGAKATNKSAGRTTATGKPVGKAKA